MSYTPTKQGELKLGSGTDEIIIRTNSGKTEIKDYNGDWVEIEFLQDIAAAFGNINYR